MSFSPGTRLGPYETVAHIGAGGMGDVYRARDTRLGRDVAIKTSKEAFDDRFQREARAIASLNHPNICTLYDVGPDYLVMEYVEGETLSDRIRQGALPEAEALAVAMQIASALEAAHDRGIVHRDLKPANIKITSEGHVKVLDFGLAKIAAGLDASANPEESPTFTAHLGTAVGTILGTAAYMAPEQARSQAVDKRADIWAFGAILWEMLTGKRPFSGDTATDCLAAVLKEQPPWQEAPPRVRPLLRRCLEKDPRKRLHDIADARLWLEESSPQDAPAAAPAQWTRAGIFFAAGLLVALAAAGLVAWRTRAVATADSIQFSVSPPQAIRLASSPAGAGSAAPSPDGRSIVFLASSRADQLSLYVHRLESGTASRLAGTEGGEWPFWSPDSKSLAFISGGKLKRLDLAGGTPVVLCDDAPANSGGDWSRNGSIILAFGDGLWKIPESGGAPQRLTKVDTEHGEVSHSSPQFLPDGKHFIYYIMTGDARTRGVYLASLDAPQTRTVLLAATNKAVYAPATPTAPEMLLYVRDQTLYAQAFDSASGRLVGEPSIIATPVLRQMGMSANAEFWASPSGLLVYRQADPDTQRRLAWVAREGTRLGELPRRNWFSSFFLSPDQRKLSIDVRNDNGVHDIWIYEFDRGTMNPQTSDPGNDFLAVWSPDGERFVFGSSRTGTSQLYQMAVGGGAPEQPITTGSIRKYPLQWTRDGKYVLYRGQNPALGKNELWALEIDGDRKPTPVVQTKFSQFAGQVSPDGRWIAYQSTDSGVNEIYAQRFPVAGPRVALSNHGGRWPKWRGDGKELYYVSADDMIVAVGVDSAADSLQPTAPKELFRAVFPDDLTNPYEVARDGKRFLVLERSDEQTRRLEVVTNWQSRLGQR